MMRVSGKFQDDLLKGSIVLSYNDRVTEKDSVRLYNLYLTDSCRWQKSRSKVISAHFEYLFNSAERQNKAAAYIYC